MKNTSKLNQEYVNYKYITLIITQIIGPLSKVT